MALKIIGCILLVGATSAAGFQLSRRLYKRRDFLKAFLVFLSSLETNIRYNSADIFTLVTSCASDDNLSFLAPKNNKEDSFETQWKKNIDDIPKSIPVSKGDRQLLYEFGSYLGKTDVDGQLKHLELYKISFAKQLSLAESAITQKSKLYKTMGFFAGTALALMMI